MLGATQGGDVEGPLQLVWSHQQATSREEATCSVVAGP